MKRKKIVETTKTISIKWTVSRPLAFQDPGQIALTQPSLSIVHFDLVFNVQNFSRIPFLLRIYIKSMTQAVCFPLDSPIRIWKRTYRIIPQRKEEEFSLDNMMDQLITPKGETNYIFHALFRPVHAWHDFRFKKRVIIVYRLLAVSEDKKMERRFS